VAFGSLGTALALALFGLVRDPVFAVGVSFVAGAAWIVVLANLYVSAQDALPDWVHAWTRDIPDRYFWSNGHWERCVGQIAEMARVPMAYFVAATGAVLAIPLTRRWKLRTGAGIDLSPSMHWPVLKLAQNVENEKGPVLITVEYHIESKDRAAWHCQGK